MTKEADDAMIAKADKEVFESIEKAVGGAKIEHLRRKRYDTDGADRTERLMEKVDELVDAVNELRAIVFGHWKVDADGKLLTEVSKDGISVDELRRQLHRLAVEGENDDGSIKS